MKSLKLNLMGVEADAIRSISIDNIDGEETSETIEITTSGGDDFVFETKHDFEWGKSLCLTVKGPDGPLVVLEQGPGMKRAVRTIADSVSTVRGTWDEFTAETDFGELHVNMLDGLLVSLKAETKELVFRVWASNPHE